MTKITKQLLLDRGFRILGRDQNWFIKDDLMESDCISICIQLQYDLVLAITLDIHREDEHINHTLPLNTPIEDIDHLIRILNL